MELSHDWVKENKGKRFNVTNTDGSVLKNISFFISTCGSICYHTGKQTRTGRMFKYWDMDTCEEITPKEITNSGNVKKLLGRMHKNVWSDLKETFEGIKNGGEIDTDFRYHFTGKLNFRSITTLLNSHERVRIQEAFENQADWTWSRNTNSPQGRDLRIETKMCSDGIFRAWFSSEYMGCGNGDYYLLLSPTTAVYYERD